MHPIDGNGIDRLSSLQAIDEIWVIDPLPGEDNSRGSAVCEPVDAFFKGHLYKNEDMSTRYIIRDTQ